MTNGHFLVIGLIRVCVLLTKGLLRNIIHLDKFPSDEWKYFCDSFDSVKCPFDEGTFFGNVFRLALVSF